MRALALLALVGGLVAAPAAARPSEAEYGAWSAEYGERYDRWYFGLVFDRDLYFHEGAASQPGETMITTNLIDAHYTVALRRFGAGWAFAIDMECPSPPGNAPRDDNACRPLLRMVSVKPEGSPHPDWLDNFLPKSREEVARVVDATFDWREADLRTCPAALTKLNEFPQVPAGIWPKDYLDWVDGAKVQPDGDINLTADGYGVSLRAAAQEDSDWPRYRTGNTGYIATQYNGGAAYDWAIAMHDAAEPCLKPATAMAPWTKALGKPDVAPAQVVGE
jgi:hypothetical protein